MDFIPGFVQGITRVLISYPFDYFRIFKQTDTKIDYKKDIKNLSFLRGIYFPLLSVPIDRSITFHLYESLKKKDYSTLECSLYPSVLSSIYMTPINLLNTNYIFFKKTSIQSILKGSFQKNIFNGLSVEVLRNTTSSVIYLYTYKKMSENTDSPFLNGSMSSIAMWTLLYPLDTIKVKRFITNQPYADIIKKTTLRGLYSGISLVYARTIPSAGIGMVMYENSKKLIDGLK